MNRLSLQALALTFLVATSGLQASAPTPSRTAKAVNLMKNGAQSVVNFGKDTASNSWQGYKSFGSAIAESALNAKTFAVLHRYKVGAALAATAVAAYYLNKTEVVKSAKAKARNAVKSVATAINNNRKKAAVTAVAGAVVAGLGLNRYFVAKAAAVAAASRVQEGLVKAHQLSGAEAIAIVPTEVAVPAVTLPAAAPEAADSVASVERLA